MDLLASAAHSLHSQPLPTTSRRPSPAPPPPSSTLISNNQSHSRPAIYDPDATIVLIGMRGVGKTTLGLIAATSLRRHFGDCDSYFESLHGPISTFVSKHGWPPFRDCETQILHKLLEERPRGWVIACGGGVVDREENVEMLRKFRDGGGVIVHVVRDKEEVVHYLIDEHRKPAWGEDFRHVWDRRTPRYESLCTHTFSSLTAYPPPATPQFRMKHVETALIRLLRSVFGLASSHVPLVAGPRPPPASGPSSGEYGGYGACESELGRGAKGPRTSFVALNFPDFRVVGVETYRRVTGGVDVIEMRVDTLVEVEMPPSNGAGLSMTPTPRKRRIPSLHHVALNFGHLRRCSPLPILFTVRTEKQGGVFPDPYVDNPDLMDEYLALLELGFKLGAEYVDLELALPDEVITRFLALRGAATQCLAADHDRKGEWNWGSQDVLDKYLRASRLGADVVKLVSTPTTFDSNLELLKFRAKVASLPSRSSSPDPSATPTASSSSSAHPAATTTDRSVPLLTLNLGKGGQISRYLNPVLTPVTHPLLPGVAAPGQLTYSQTQQALFLSGLILEKTFFVPSLAVAESFTREATALGLPYTFLVEDRLPMREIEPNFGGAYLGAPSHAISTSASSSSSSSPGIPEGDEVLPPAAASGWADLCVPASTEPTSYDVPPSPRGWYKHTNVRVLALAEVITQNLSPINAVGTHTCALLVGLRRKDKNEVLEALRMVGARWVFLLACEADEGQAVLQEGETDTFPSPAVSRPTSPRIRSGGGGEGAASPFSAPTSFPSHLFPSSAPPSRPLTPSQQPPPPTSQPQAPTPSSLPYPLHAPLTLLPVSSFTSPLLYSKRAPTIIVGSDDLCPAGNGGGGGRYPEQLFASHTGGCSLDLSTYSASSHHHQPPPPPLPRSPSSSSSSSALPSTTAHPSSSSTSIASKPHSHYLSRIGHLTRSIDLKRERSDAALRAAGKRVPSGAAAADGWMVLGVREVQGEGERQAFRALTGRRMG